MKDAENQVRCPRCAVALVPGMALENTLCGFPDFPGERASEGMTLSYSGPARQIACLKCPACGHSVRTMDGARARHVVVESVRPAPPQ